MYKCRCDGSLAQRLPLSLELTCKPLTCAVLVVPTDDGRYRCTYTPDTPGFYRLEVTCKDIHLCGSPFSVQVTRNVLQSSIAPTKGLPIRRVPWELILFVLLSVLASAFFRFSVHPVVALEDQGLVILVWCSDTYSQHVKVLLTCSSLRIVAARLYLSKSCCLACKLRSLHSFEPHNCSIKPAELVAACTVDSYNLKHERKGNSLRLLCIFPGRKQQTQPKRGQLMFFSERDNAAS